MPTNDGSERSIYKQGGPNENFPELQYFMINHRGIKLHKKQHERKVMN